MIADKVKETLGNSRTWVLATAGETPNVVTTAFHEIGAGDQLIFYQVFLNKTVENVKAGSDAAVLANPDGSMEAYQLKGKASYTTDPELVAKGNAMAAPMGLEVKGAIVVDVDTVYVLTPGPDNGKIV